MALLWHILDGTFIFKSVDVKIKISVIIYSPSCHSKTVWLLWNTKEDIWSQKPFGLDWLLLYALKSNDTIEQGSSNLTLEVQSAAEFSSNPDQTHLPVIF